jgi:hypothetical protein
LSFTMSPSELRGRWSPAGQTISVKTESDGGAAAKAQTIENTITGRVTV